MRVDPRRMALAVEYAFTAFVGDPGDGEFLEVSIMDEVMDITVHVLGASATYRILPMDEDDLKAAVEDAIQRVCRGVGEVGGE